MSLAEHIREHVLKTRIEPARNRGQQFVTLRVGDIHRELALKSRQPAIAGALGTRRFEMLAHVQTVQRIGPHLGGNLWFTFEII
jgi:5-methylcytosine-specific restriction protein B